MLSNSCFFLEGSGGSGIVKCGLTNCNVILVAAYRHLSPFAYPGVSGSFADGEVCLDTLSRYYDRSLPPNLVVYKCSFLFITSNTVAFDILNQI